MWTTRTGRYPFSVAGYTITDVGAAKSSKTLVITLKEQSTQDIEARPQIVYSETKLQPVTAGGKQVAAQTFKQTSPLDLDGDGYTVADGDCAPTNPAIHPGAIDLPDLAFVDSNCDGIDGDAAQAIFVSPTGSDSNPGTEAFPKATIQSAITAAAAQKPPFSVYVAVGNYSGTVTLASGVSVYGGYNATTWARPAGATVLTGGPAASANGATGVTLQFLTLHGILHGTAPSTTYGLLATNHAQVTLDDVKINADAGVTGNGGAPGYIGNPGAAGASATGNGQGAGGGAGSGGAGGAGPVDGKPGTNGSDPSGSGLGGAGGSGGTGANPAGNGGAATGVGTNGTVGSDTVCFCGHGYAPSRRKERGAPRATPVRKAAVVAGVEAGCSARRRAAPPSTAVEAARVGAVVRAVAPAERGGGGGGSFGIYASGSTITDHDRRRHHHHRKRWRRRHGRARRTRWNRWPGRRRLTTPEMPEQAVAAERVAPAARADRARRVTEARASASSTVTDPHSSGPHKQSSRSGPEA